MESVTVTRDVAAAPERVREAMADIGAFMRDAGFDEVHVAGDTLTLVNSVGLFDLELVLDIEDRPGTALAYSQRDGIFREMWTEYTVEPHDGGSRVTATTEYEVDAAFVGPVFDSTVVKRQRRKELNAQFDALEDR